MHNLTKTCCFILLFLSVSVFGKEGLWLPNLLGQLNEAEMKSLGMKISADDIYSINHASLKDAVVQFGSGCTGEIISGRGLLLTNHHCGFSQIQSLSSLDNNYLKNGFWANSLADEMPCPGLTATFIIEIRNVSENILPFLTDTMSEKKRQTIVKGITDSLEQSATAGTHYKAFTKSFYQGNEYYLFISEVFRDIRFVGAPPFAIGKFGGETDNWMWPRHQADISLFRIYAGPDNKPADYSKDNRPFQPRYFFPVNIGGVQEGDFTMVLGFPGRTNAYLPADGLEMIYSQTNPIKIKIREERLRIWNDAMLGNDTIFLQYSSKYKTLANYYKKWKGENSGLQKQNAIGERRNFDRQFLDWAKSDSLRKEKYGSLLDEFAWVYGKGKLFSSVNDVVSETLLSIELVNYVGTFRTLIESCHREQPDLKAIHDSAEKLKNSIAASFKNYSRVVDESVCAAMLKLAWETLPDTMRPEIYQNIRNEYRLDFRRYTQELFSKTIFLQQEKLSELLNGFNLSKCKKLEKDPAWILTKAIEVFSKTRVQPGNTEFMENIFMLQRRYMRGILEMKKNTRLYPDANSTLRVSYGRVEGMKPRDGVSYSYSTTLDGLVEKEGQNTTEFIVPPDLKQMNTDRNFGEYGENGILPLNFLASNHTTNGNSGSPVLNAKGELIGINFDRIAEGVMSDLMYVEKLGRNISVDTRYILFLIDKYSGAGWLLNEMKIVRE